MTGTPDEHLTFFEEQGYLLAKGLLDPVQDLDPVMREYEGGTGQSGN